MRPGWTTHIIDFTFFNSRYAYVDVLDVDGDGDPDAPYGGWGSLPQALGWAENQNNGTEWVLHDFTTAEAIQRIPTGLGDIDGDGDTDIISLTFDVATGIGSVLWAANPKISVGISDPHANGQQPSLSIVPNPFSSATTIQYQLHEPGEVHFSVYNLLGQRIHTLSHDREDTGTYSLTWDGKMENGERAPQGVYWVRLDTESGRVSEAVIVN